MSHDYDVVRAPEQALFGVLAFEPKFCPKCGRSKINTPQSAIDWDLGQSRECKKCGTILGRAWAHDIIKIAEAYPQEVNQSVPEVRESEEPALDPAPEVVSPSENA